MQHYYHSVRLDMDKCKGCTTCLKRCPTEAIRIRNNRASILNERCIDCGECIKVCANHAKVAVTDPLESIKRFKYPIALPAPTLYAQFQGVHQPEPIIASLFRLGFVDEMCIRDRQALESGRPVSVSSAPNCFAPTV